MASTLQSKYIEILEHSDNAMEEIIVYNKRSALSKIRDYVFIKLRNKLPGSS